VEREQDREAAEAREKVEAEKLQSYANQEKHWELQKARKAKMAAEAKAAEERRIWEQRTRLLRQAASLGNMFLRDSFSKAKVLLAAVISVFQAAAMIVPNLITKVGVEYAH
jgi:hypothetical protein